MGKCDVCHVEIPDNDEAIELHESGKKHIRAKMLSESLNSLGMRSVFLKWSYPDHSAMKITPGNLKEEMLKFGAIDRILFREESTYAIVEFSEIESANSALLGGNVVVDMIPVKITQRRMNFGEKDTEKKTIDVDKVILEAKGQNSFADQIDAIIQLIVISDEQMKIRNDYTGRLEEVLSHYFVNPKVRIFGSSITSIGICDSDIDACLDLLPPDDYYIPDLNRDKFTLLTCEPTVLKGRKVNQLELYRLSAPGEARFTCRILNEIRKDVGWIGHQRPVLDARCPVVRFIADKKVLIDLSVDNRLGCAKSDYLKTLIESDNSGNLRRIFLGFRFWALSNGLFEPMAGQHKGHFNAYMLNLLVIGFMQTVGLLPPFTFSAKEAIAENYRIDFQVPAYSLAAVDLPSFFRDFFIHFVSLSGSDVVYSIQENAILPKEHFLARFPDLKDKFKFNLLNFQDPLELAHNVCQNLSEKCVGLMRRQMMFSLSILKHNRSSFCDILSLSESRPSSAAQIHSADAVSTFPCGQIELSSTLVSSALRELLEEVLSFEIASEPSCKRGRFDSENSLSIGSFYVRYPVWVGRRNIRRKLVSQGRADNLQLEREVTKSLMSVSKPCSSLIRVRLEIVMYEEKLSVLFHRIEGSPADVTNIAHFLEQLLEKFKEPLLLEMGHSSKSAMETS